MSYNVALLHRIEERRARIPKLLYEGLTVTQIAKELGVNRRTIHRDLKHIGQLFLKKSSNLERILGEITAKYYEKCKAVTQVIDEVEGHDKARAIRIQDKIDNNFYDFLFRIGILKRAPTELIVEKKTTDVRQVFMELRSKILNQQETSKDSEDTFQSKPVKFEPKKKKSPSSE